MSKMKSFLKSFLCGSILLVCIQSHICNRMYHIKHIFATVLNVYLNAVCPAVALDQSNIDHLIILRQIHWKSYSTLPKLSSER